MMTTSGIVFNIQHYSIHDGPGIRTLVFLKGCPLRCAWCVNPESQLSQPEIAVLPNRCIGCGRCISNCPEQAITSTQTGNLIDRNKCTACGVCCEVCYAEDLQMKGCCQTVCEVLKKIEGDRIFYEHSGGGVTLSVGEPFFQADFTLAFLKACKERGINTVVETCGFAPFEKILPCLPFLDLILYDIKHLDSDVHKLYTGVENSLILENARRLASAGANLVVRVPIVPGYNDSEDNLLRTVEFVKGIGVNEMHLLPYHGFGAQKYRQLGREYKLDIAPPTPERMEEIRQMLSGKGIAIQVGG